MAVVQHDLAPRNMLYYFLVFRELSVKCAVYLLILSIFFLFFSDRSIEMFAVNVGVTDAFLGQVEKKKKLITTKTRKSV